MLRDFGARLQKELKATNSVKYVKVTSPPEREISVWIGGSIFASLSTFQEYYFDKSDYDEFGSNIVNLRCF